MSRIKGGYYLKSQLQEWVVRWLDTDTGAAFLGEKDRGPMLTGFVQQPNGTWACLAGYEFIPDTPAPVNWYVIRMVPDDFRGRPEREGGYPPVHSAFGPYTEAEARANAALRSEKSAGRDTARNPAKPYAVVQVQVGNTVTVQPPAPPAPVANWT